MIRDPDISPVSAARRRDALNRAEANAPFLAMLVRQRPELVDVYCNHGAAAALALASPLPPPGASVVEAMALLRGRRSDLALILALADLSGEHDFATTVECLSDFADAAVDAALTAAFCERTGEAAVRGLVVIALGKQGSRELNYSSDIDPILLFDPRTLPRRQRDDPVDVAVRIARRWVDILSLRTGDGYVLRVDLRLRPSSEVTPIALPVDAALSHYESQALAWEQAAFIRARVCGGDRQLGAYFLESIQPFVWRRSHDFGQIQRIADISHRIRGHYASGQRFGPGYDLKRGRGGIREVEFFAQVLQLIHGGRDTRLRAPATCDALAALAVAGHIDAETAADQQQSYILLRTIEHRLQMVADQQTHRLPDGAVALDTVARLHGLPDGQALLALLDPVVQAVGSRFDLLIGTEANTPVPRWPHEAQAMAMQVQQAGFVDTAAVVRRIDSWRSGTMRVLRSAAAQQALEDVLPALMRALGSAPDADTALLRFDALVAGMPSAVNFFTLLAARPQLLATLVAILAHAPTLAADLSMRAELIDGLIDASIFAERPTKSGLASQMAGHGGSYEKALDHVRRVVGEHRFALGVQLVEQARDPLAIARDYSEVAEAALDVLTQATIAEFETSHGRIAGGELVILALGRLGGSALTHASDLDLILLFTGDLTAESDGARPLGTTLYFNRLGQRVIAALSVPTAAGQLYEVDTRLRPQGVQGPLVSSLSAFARYQRADAWVWEHMALTRARVVFGSAAVRAQVENVIADVLAAPRQPVDLVRAVAKMRDDITAHKPPSGPLDVKLVDGGLVDLEFAIHSQQLLHHAGQDPRLDLALVQLAAAGLAPVALPDAHDLLTRMLVTMRLMAPGGDTDDPETRARIAAICGAESWQQLLAAYDTARQTVRDWWQSIRAIADEETTDGDSG